MVNQEFIRDVISSGFILSDIEVKLEISPKSIAASLICMKFLTPWGFYWRNRIDIKKQSFILKRLLTVCPIDPESIIIWVCCCSTLNRI